LKETPTAPKGAKRVSDEALEEEVNAWPPSSVTTLLDLSKSGSGREIRGFISLVWFMSSMSQLNRLVNKQVHVDMRRFLDTTLDEAQMHNERILECATRLVIMRVALGVQDGFRSKLVSQSVTRLEELQRELGPEGLGRWFYPAVAACARYAYVTGTSAEDFKIAIERYQYIYGEMENWQDTEPMLEFVSKADFLVWYSDALVRMGSETRIAQAKEMLEEAAYKHHHADAIAELLTLLDPKSSKYHDCLCSLACFPDRRGAEAAMELAKLYSLPDEEFKLLDRELQLDIKSPPNITMRDSIPKIPSEAGNVVVEQFRDTLKTIMREYAKLGVLRHNAEPWDPLKVPMRIFKACYWYQIALFQTDDAFPPYLELVKNHNLVLEGILGRLMVHKLWRSNPKWYTDYTDKAQRDMFQKVATNFMPMLRWYSEERPVLRRKKQEEKEDEKTDEKEKRYSQYL
jgi:hypothetical protein